MMGTESSSWPKCQTLQKYLKQQRLILPKGIKDSTYTVVNIRYNDRRISLGLLLGLRSTTSIALCIGTASTPIILRTL